MKDFELNFGYRMDESDIADLYEWNFFSSFDGVAFDPMDNEFEILYSYNGFLTEC